MKQSKLLLILQLNQTCLFLSNRVSKYVNHAVKIKDIKFHQQYNNYDILFRRGRVQFLQYVFQIASNQLDIAVWSHLQTNMTQNLSQRFFGRYFRKLLFIMATNRQLYVNSSNVNLQQPIKIRKDLSAVYNKFPQYQPGNTLVISPFDNLIQQYRKNDLIIPSFTPQNPTFTKDGGLQALSKYIKGLCILKKQRNIDDIRSLSSSKHAGTLFDRYAFNVFTPRNQV